MTSLSDVSFFVAGKPLGQPRPRACIRGRHAGVYDSGTAKPWKDQVTRAARQACASAFEGPLSLEVVFYLPKPKKSAWLFPIARPDLDNYIKSTMDALTDARIWTDDSQVVRLESWKLYELNDGPGAGIRVRTLGSQEEA